MWEPTRPSKTKGKAVNANLTEVYEVSETS